MGLATQTLDHVISVRSAIEMIYLLYYVNTPRLLSILPKAQQ